MSYTKRQLVEAAHAEIGLADYVFDLPTEALQRAVKTLDGMVAEWNARGVRLGYPLPSSPEGGDLDTETGLPDSAWQAVITNLALRIAPQFGKQVMPETRATAVHSYDTLVAIAAMPQQQSYGRIPAGAGNKPWRYYDPFLPDPAPQIDAGPDSEIELL